MWDITVQEILNLQGQGGDPFTRLMNALIVAQAQEAGVPQSQIDVTPRSNHRDGGVDAAVATHVTPDSTGYFELPTAWQYKATDLTNVRSADLVSGDYLRELLAQGYAYRIAICDGVPAQARARLAADVESRLQDVVPELPPVILVSAGDLIPWLQRFPSILLQFFRPQLADTALHFDAWGQNVTAHTPNYVDVTQRRALAEKIRAFSRFAAEDQEPFLAIQGRAGVGKTRLTYEALAQDPASHALVVACFETRAEQLATLAANNESVRALIVADECAPSVRYRLSQILDGHSHRIRVIALDNSMRRPDREDPEYWLDPMSDSAIREVLDENYPQIPAENRRAYARLAGGFPRMAVHFCENYDPADEGLGEAAIPATITEYLRVKLSEEEARVLDALSLVTRIGFSRDVANEVEILCDALGLAHDRVRDLATELKQGSGFVMEAGRYCYVTPEVVVRIAFRRAWSRWAEPDPGRFLDTFPPPLLERLLERVSDVGGEEVRRVCGQHFRDWADQLDATALQHVEAVRRFRTLCETDPDRYLRRLAEIVSEAPAEVLSQVTGDWQAGGWGPRRTLVWLAEHLAAFPEYFESAEEILFHLASAESEPDIANNASAQWAQLFRVYLSGTAVPFLQRAEHLERRLRDDDASRRRLAIQAVASALGHRQTRTLGPALVAGRIPPPEWRPSGAEELEACRLRLLQLLEERIGEAEERSADTDVALDALLSHGRLLLYWGILDRLKRIIGSAPLRESELVAWRRELRMFLQYDADKFPDDYVEGVRSWLEELKPSGLHEELVALIHSDRFELRLEEGGGDESTTAVERLASALLADRAALHAELEWLLTAESDQAFDLGVHLAAGDEEGELVADVLTHLSDGHASFLARGYWKEMGSRAHPSMESLNAWLDEYETERPGVVFDVARAAGRRTDLLGRTVRLYDEGLLTVEHLHLLPFIWAGYAGEELTPLVERLARAGLGGDERAVRTGVDSLHHMVRRLADEGSNPFDEETFRSSAWSLLDASSSVERGSLHWWGDVVAYLARYDDARAISMCATALVGESFDVRDQALVYLVEAAGSAPRAVMNAVGEVVLNHERSWVFHVGDFSTLLSSIPDEVLREWLEATGVDGARMVAPHLPAPYISAEGPVVPDLTEWVLEEFEEDDRVFSQFSVGIFNRGAAWVGSAVPKFEADAELAAHFRNHPVRRIREWAERTMTSARHMAEVAEIEEAEERFR